MPVSNTASSNNANKVDETKATMALVTGDKKFINPAKTKPTPEIISILDFLPTTNNAGDLTPVGEMLELRVNMFKRNRDTVRFYASSLFSVDTGDETPDTLETFSNNVATRKLHTASELLSLNRGELWPALGENFDYYTDTTFQAIELIFSTSEIFDGSFNKIKNYYSPSNAYDLTSLLSAALIPDFKYPMDGISTSLSSLLKTGYSEETIKENLYAVTLNSLDKFSNQFKYGNYGIDSSIFEESLYFTVEDQKKIRSMGGTAAEKVSALFFILGKRYSSDNFDKNYSGVTKFNIDTFINDFKEIIEPSNNSGYNFFVRDNDDQYGAYKGYEQFLKDIFEHAVENLQDHFDPQKFDDLQDNISRKVLAFILTYYPSWGFFDEDNFITHYYSMLALILEYAFPDKKAGAFSFDDILIYMIKHPSIHPDVEFIIWDLFELYERDKFDEMLWHITDSDIMHKLFPWASGYAFDSTIQAFDTDPSESRFFSIMKQLVYYYNANLHDKRKLKFCTIEIFIELIKACPLDAHVTGYWSNGGATIKSLDFGVDSEAEGWSIIDILNNSAGSTTKTIQDFYSSLGDDGIPNNATNFLTFYNFLKNIYTKTAEQHFEITRYIAGFKSLEGTFAKASRDVKSIKYLNNEALKALQPHAHMLSDFPYKHAFRIKNFYDLLQHFNLKFTPKKFNLSYEPDIKLFESFASQDKCIMTKKEQSNRKKKIFSIGIKNNDIKTAINNMFDVDGDYKIMLKILVEKELAVFNGIKFLPLEFIFDLSSHIVLNNYEISGLSNNSERQLLFETTDDVIESNSFDTFIENNMKQIRFRNSFSEIGDFIYESDIKMLSPPDFDVAKNRIESDILKNYIYRIYGIDMSESTFISNRKGPDDSAAQIIENQFTNSSINLKRLLLNKSILFNGEKFSSEVLQESKFEKIINILVDVENDFKIDTENLELNDLSNTFLLNEYSTADHYDFKISSEIFLEEV